MTKFKLAILDDYQQASLDSADWSPVLSDCEITVLHDHLSTSEEAVTRLASFDGLVIMRERMALPGALLRELPRLRYIGIVGSAVRSVDLDVARTQGITICTTRPSPTGLQATAELTWALILGASRNIPQEDANMRAGGWQRTLGRTLHGGTLGLLGLGAVGQAVARIGNAFGMKILAWSHNLTPDTAALAGATAVDRATLFASSDVVSIHLRLSERTNGLVSADDIGLMPTGALLVNTSRAAIVEREPLMEALRARRIRAALDVYWSEPPRQGDPIRFIPGTLLSPHLGYVTQENHRLGYADSVENLRRYLDGQPIRTIGPPP